MDPFPRPPQANERTKFFARDLEQNLRSGLTFLVLALAIGLSGFIMYDSQKQQITREIYDQLAAVAELKVRQIEAWRQERLGGGKVASQADLIVRQVHQFVLHPERRDSKDDIAAWMSSFQDAFGYRSILLVEPGGKVLLAVGEHSGKAETHAVTLAQAAIRQRRPLLSDFHTADAAPYPHLDLAAPLFDAGGQASAVLLYRIDPATFLYPLIQSWPTRSRTGETLIFRIEGDRVLFLNELRHRTDTALKLTLPIDAKRTAAAMAMQGRTGISQGVDYRDVKVLEASAAVTGTPWLLVSKIDEDEVYGPLRQRAWYIGITTLLLIGAAGLTVLFRFRKTGAENFRKHMEAQFERQALRERYDYLSKYANDIILLLDGAGRIVEANDRAVDSFGYTRPELLGLALSDLRTAETIDDMEQQMKLVHEQNGLVFETVHRRKDGSTFPAETSSLEIEAGGRTVYQFIIRDITERRRAEEQVRESQKLLQTIVDTEPECIKLLSREGDLLMMNRAGLEMIQADSFETVKGQRVAAMVKPEHREAFMKAIEEVFQGRSARLEFEVKGLKGRELWLETHAVPLRDEQGRITAMLGVTRDITERKKADRSIRTITRLYAVLSQIDQAIVRAAEQQELFDSVCRTIVWYGQFKMAWIGTLDPESLVVKPAAFSGTEDGYLNDITLSLKDEPQGRGPTDVAIRTGRYVVCNDIETDPETAAFRDHAGRRGYRSSAAFPLTLQERTIGALTIYSSEQDFFNHDEVKLLDEIATDISFALENFELDKRRRKAETELVREKNRSQAIIAAIGDGISIQDRNYKVIYQNEQHVSMAGHHIGEYCYQAYARRSEICEGCPVELSIKDGRVHTLEKSSGQNGGALHFEIAASALRDEDGNVLAGIEALREITDRKQAELSLVESEKRYKLLVQSITDYIYTVTVEQGRPVKTAHGPGCLAVTGFSSAEFERDSGLWYRIIHGEDRAAVVEHANRILSGQPVAPFEHRIVHKNGTLRWIRNTPVPRFNEQGELVDYDGLISNITQLKQLEAQLRQAQKMEAVGQLAGGIAHDFNNILTAIIGYGNLLRMKLPSDTPLRTYVEQILASSERAANLTHSLLAFSRKQIIDLKPIDLNAVIGRVERLLQRLIGEDIEFRTHLAPGSLPVLSDSVQIEQVLMNLVTNARDAMPNGGMLQIETSVFEMGEEFQRTHAYGKPGSYALVSVTDTGTGMDERTRAKIFDPFFTTKEVGKGTGLGLAMVYGIVKQHSGYINVYSEPGKGTSFKIYLPLTAPLDRPLPAEAPSPSHQGTETVLLAEDDVEVRKLTRTVLEDFGYRVIEAEDGEAAVSRFSADPDGVDMLVFDMIMPKKNGREAYLEIKALRPGVKALFMSGYTADVAHKKGILDTGLDFVLKPISPTDFLKKVREVLDRK